MKARQKARPGEDTAVCGEAGDGDADMVVCSEDLALVGSEVGGSLVDGGEDGVRGGAEANGGGALLDGLHGVLHLEETPSWTPRRHISVVLVAKHPFFLFLFLLFFPVLAQLG